MTPTQHTVLITGGATGIGFALAKKFHAAGNRVILVGRREDVLRQAVEQLSGSLHDNGARCGYAVADSVVFMDGGQIVEAGSPDEFFSSPRTERARDFLSKVLSH